jgi:3-dehydrosphinganine reductase
MKIKANLEPGKVAIVTGGSSGIGKAIACSLAERGMHVWLVAQRKDILEAARTEVEAHRMTPDQKIHAVSTDVSNLDQVRKLISQIMEETGTPDLLVNSAGVTYPGYVETLDINIFYWMMEVNYYGTVYMTKEVLPAMIARGSGYFLNICSLSGVISSFGYTAYGASKYAVHGFSEALRMEMKVHGIGVSIIFPTDTDTPQLAYENQFKPVETRALNSAGGMNTADAIARHAIKGIERGQYNIMPNLDAKLIHLLHSLSPSLVNYIVDIIVANAVKKKIAQEGKKV